MSMVTMPWFALPAALPSKPPETSPYSRQPAASQACVLVFFRPPHPDSHQPFTERREYVPVGSTAAVPAADVRDRPLPTGLLRGRSKGSFGGVRLALLRFELMGFAALYPSYGGCGACFETFCARGWMEWHCGAIRDKIAVFIRLDHCVHASRFAELRALRMGLRQRVRARIRWGWFSIRKVRVMCRRRWRGRFAGRCHLSSR